MNLAQYENTFAEVNHQFGGQGVLRHVKLNFTTKKFFEEFKYQIHSNRWGEVAFGVERKNKKLIVIRSQGYPKGIYRIPTGGIQFDETVSHALHREIKEELGLTVDTPRFMGAIYYEVIYKEEKLEFISFVFHLKEISGTILEDATEQEIGEYLEADKETLAKICLNMEQHCGSWQDWCQFRLQTTSFLLPYL
ncbi:MAG: NUDIX hydrolase [Ruminococcaceae bacterium]|nr:NUDIX hydrolase [Oscillospiraceae bacterium]